MDLDAGLAACDGKLRAAEFWVYLDMLAISPVGFKPREPQYEQFQLEHGFKALCS